MLYVEIPEMEMFDEENSVFVSTKKETLQLEHSLVSLSKWESKWCKPFLGLDEKTNEELLDYIRCMTITQNVKSEIFHRIPKPTLVTIDNYINHKMTATWFAEEKGRAGSRSREIITAEIIYYWMFLHNIPMECQKWHLNRLLTLIKVCNEKSRPDKKRGRKESAQERAALNAARMAKYKTRG